MPTKWSKKGHCKVCGTEIFKDRGGTWHHRDPQKEKSHAAEPK